jgi:signal transduction histidine kinase
MIFLWMAVPQGARGRVRQSIEGRDQWKWRPGDEHGTRGQSGKARALGAAVRDEVYFIAREAIRNAYRHAAAVHIEAEVIYGPAVFSLHVRDDGVGIEPDVIASGGRAGHWGLAGMRERATGFGGHLEIWSRPGAGTEMALTVPAASAYLNTSVSQ